MFSTQALYSRWLMPGHLMWSHFIHTRLASCFRNRAPTAVSGNYPRFQVLCLHTTTSSGVAPSAHDAHGLTTPASRDSLRSRVWVATASRHAFGSMRSAPTLQPVGVPPTKKRTCILVVWTLSTLSLPFII